MIGTGIDQGREFRVAQFDYDQPHLLWEEMGKWER